METSTPNLFHFATSELSQDAFIAWLISWADQQYASKNAALHQTGVELLDTLFDKVGHSKPDKYDSVEVKLQYKHIDLFVKVNGTIPMIIEDKTFTSEGPNQLETYSEIVKNEFPSFQDIPAIYFKTGDQSNYRGAEQANYKVFSRSDFLKVLQSGIDRGVTSEILLDYRDHLKRLDDEVESFWSVAVKEWKSGWNGWVGFFKQLQEKLGDGEWGYVPNSSGGFMCYHWCHTSPATDIANFEVYLQLEESRLCFKIRVFDVKRQAEQWENWHQKLKRASESISFPFERPSRRKNGRWMTVGINERYLQEREDGLLDIDETVAVLKRAEEVLEDAAKC